MLFADYGHRWMMDNGDRPWLWTIGMLAVAGFWIIIIWAGASLARRAFPSRSTPQTPVEAGQTRTSAEQILAERLARGEIDPDDYRHRLEVLRSSTVAQPPAG